MLVTVHQMHAMGELELLVIARDRGEVVVVHFEHRKGFLHRRWEFCEALEAGTGSNSSAWRSACLDGRCKTIRQSCVVQRRREKASTGEPKFHVFKQEPETSMNTRLHPQ